MSFGMRTSLGLHVDDDGATPVETSDAAAPVANYFRWSHWVSRTAGAILLVPTGLATLALVLLVRLTSRGPGIYSQVRVGRGGQPYKMYKIRTMRSDAEAETGAVWARHNDPRITRVGRVLRALHLDELPQVWNMVRGEMALIGPRPERPEFTDVLAREIPDYCQRLQVLPGITGLAQINLPPDSDLDSVKRKLTLDLEYIAHATLGLDARIAMRTVMRLCNIHGDWPSQFLGIYRQVDLPKRKSPTIAVFDADEDPKPAAVTTTAPAPMLRVTASDSASPLG